MQAEKKESVWGNYRELKVYEYSNVEIVDVDGAKRVKSKKTDKLMKANLNGDFIARSSSYDI